MRVYRMRTYSSEEGECIEWYARKKDAAEAIENHRPFSCPFGPSNFDEDVAAVDVPDTKPELICWLNENVRGARL
jgi:hypothetical protein